MAAIIFKFAKVIVSPPIIILGEFPVTLAAERLVAMEEALVPPLVQALVPPPANVALSVQAYSHSCDYLFLLKMYSS